MRSRLLGGQVSRRLYAEGSVGWGPSPENQRRVSDSPGLGERQGAPIQGRRYPRLPREPDQTHDRAHPCRHSFEPAAEQPPRHSPESILLGGNTMAILQATGLSRVYGEDRGATWGSCFRTTTSCTPSRHVCPRRRWAHPHPCGHAGRRRRQAPRDAGGFHPRLHGQDG